MIQIRTADDIERTIHLRLQSEDVPLTDLTPISTLRILIRAMHVEEFAALWEGLVLLYQDWLITTARGADLDRRLADFGLTRPPASAASGEVTIVAGPSGATIAPGTVVKSVPIEGEPKRYVVSAKPFSPGGVWTIEPDSADRVRIVAAEVGERGNAAAGEITAFENTPAGVLSVTNELPVIGGTNVASDEEFREFFRRYLLSLSGATRGHLIHHILEYTDATGAKPVHSVALEEWDGVNLLASFALRIWIAGPSGSADLGLIEAIQTLVDGRDTEAEPGHRAAGVRTVVVSAVPIQIPVSLTVDLSREVAVEETRRKVAETVAAFIARTPVSGRKITGEPQGQIIFAQLFRAVMNVPGVLRAVFVTPHTDIVLETGQKAIPGPIHVSVGSVS